MYRKAADQGHDYAQYNLGLYYGKGVHITRDYKEAMRLFRESADQGYAPAQYSVGLHYDRGWGVSQNDTEAVRWYRKAAEQGDILAQIALGGIYLRGAGGLSEDPRQAARLFAAASAQGSPLADLSLGYLYAEGRGVPRDDEKAADLFDRAARSGSPDVASRARRAKASLNSGDEILGAAALILGAIIVSSAVLDEGSDAAPSDGEWLGKFWCEFEWGTYTRDNNTVLRCSDRSGRSWIAQHGCRRQYRAGWCNTRDSLP